MSKTLRTYKCPLQACGGEYRETIPLSQPPTCTGPARKHTPRQMKEKKS